ncbi:GspH/FimT family protein [Rickettsiella endosymbiont of Dermanyssus gallinae]|uniref:GspH/FimT family protein n=1 Tax=Rickettsiella endosymbiont of Dermanyssus gallinae TaxID=2856608 RepID=UPI001C52EA4D|nr:GspH/FimT family pseudopilin [Rickettsiella endosymbiont of Dermanyssus gallinae]
MYKKTAARKSVTKKESGFSLLDLLFTLVLLSILLSLSFPAYKYLMVEIRLLTLTERITSALNYARSEAIRHRSIVILCPSKNGKTCNGQWRNGWNIVLGRHTENFPENSLLRVYPALNKHEFLIWHGAGRRDYVQLNPDGSAYGHNGSFVVCVKVLATSTVWLIKVSATGRIRIDKGLGLQGNCHY